jgi:hypothetical protein
MHRSTRRFLFVTLGAELRALRAVPARGFMLRGFRDASHMPVGFASIALHD